jgi:hypothetical protein
MNEHHTAMKDVLDILAIFSTIGTFLEVISPVFGFIGAIVGVMRIVEMATGKSFAEAVGWKKSDNAKQE